MKLFAKLMLLLLIAALAAPFILRGQDGRPMATFDDVRAKFTSAGRDARAESNALAKRLQREAGQMLGNENAGKTAVYRWRDAQGGWNFSDEPPAGIESELIYIDGDANLLGAMPAATQADAPPPAPDPTAAPSLRSPLSVIEDAREARKAMEERPLPD